MGGDLYGTTNVGGDHGFGTVFRIDASGSVSTSFSFDISGDDPNFPIAGLILADDGKLYGTSPIGGALGDGTVYRFDPSSGTATTIHSFDRDTGGWHAITPVTLASDGNLYLITANGHCDDDSDSCAAIFRMTTAGTGVTTLHTFDPEADGLAPLSPLLQTSADDFFGTTTLGPNGDGRVFHMSGAGTVTLVHEFSDDEGRVPVGSLLKGSDGNLYGVAASGGASFKGTIFRIDSEGTFTVLHSFDGTDGALPEAGLIEASDGFFYGTTERGGASDLGTLFRMDGAGNVVAVHDFEAPGNAGAARGPSRTTGSITPTAGLLDGGDGSLYGVRLTGGDQDLGIVFRYTLGATAPLFCPNAFVRRDQMAVFLLKTEHGADHVPPDCAGTFPDVTCPSLFADWIEELASEGITAGCGGGDYCPLSPITRAQMAVFLLKTEHGTGFTPPACVGTFTDVPCSDPFAAWIEALAAENITAGCGGGNFCPASPVTRAQMAAFLLKVEHGAAFAPPACVPLFADVVCPSLFADWIEELYAEGITAGCSGGAP